MGVEQWREVILGDVCEFQKGFAFKSADYQQSGTPIVKVSNLNKENITITDCICLDSAKAVLYRKYQLEKNDIIIATVGSWASNPNSVVGKVARVQIEADGFLLNQNAVRLRHKENVEQLFIYYLLKSQGFSDYIVGTAQGSANQASIKLIDIKAYSFNLPSQSTQQKIAKILSSLDDKIELNNRMNENLEAQAQAVFKSWYNQSEEEVPFTSLIELLGGGTPKTTTDSFWNGKIPFFTPKDVASPYTLRTEKNITNDGLNHCNSRLYPINTVFVTARGTVGKVGLAGVPMAMNQSCYALCGRGIDQLLVYYYTLETVGALKHKANGAVFDAITTKDFQTETIYRLSEEHSTSFVKTATAIYKTILKNTIENQTLAQLRDTLLPRLMSGEIDVDGVEV